MIRYLAVLIILFSANIAASYSPGDIEWAAGVSGTLNTGNTLINGEYSVKAVQFPSGVPGIKDITGNIVPETDVEASVLIEIYKNRILLNKFIMSPKSEPYIDPDYEVKVTSTDFPAKNAQVWIYDYYSPWATISIQKRGLPELDVTITTDKSSYTSYDDTTITATATVINRGDARAQNVDLNINIGDLKLSRGDINQLHQHYYSMEAGTSRSFSFILEIPKLLGQKSYTLSADAKGFDVKEFEYNATSTNYLNYITVSPKPVDTDIIISKAVKDRIYLQDIAMVSITVGNDGVYEIKNINVTDSMNENFELKSNTSLQWDIPSLKPGENWRTTYSIAALEPNLNGLPIPAVNAQFTFNNRQYKIYSGTNTVVVYGPKIVMEKTVDKHVVNMGDEVTVTVSINNKGNILTNAAVNDSLPEGISLVKGMTSLSFTSLELNTPKTFSYIIKMNKDGEIKLPSAKANYTSFTYSGTKRLVSESERPVITVINPINISSTPTEIPTPVPTQITPKEIITTPSPTNIPEPTPTPVASGFNIVFAFFVLVVTALYRHK